MPGSASRHLGLKTVVRLVIWLGLAAAVFATLKSLHATYVDSRENQRISDSTVRTMGLVPHSVKHLSNQFTDSHTRMLADPPSSANQYIDPPNIVVAHLVDADGDNPSIDWEEFDKHLSKMVGRPVTDQKFENSPDDLMQVKDGKITVVALHAAETPFLVNQYGFQPFAVLGDESGAEGNHLDILVPADSSVSQPSDLRSHDLVCTVPSSITGYRAAIALLMNNQGLRPNVDYNVIWSMGQKKSINGIVKHQYKAAAVSDDKLQSMVKHGKVNSSQYKVIFQSQVIPRTTIGYFYNLNSDLAAKIRQATLAYTPQNSADTSGTGDDTSDSGSSKPMHFVPIDYKKDFELVREIDDSFDPRLGAKPSKHHEAAATQP